MSSFEAEFEEPDRYSKRMSNDEFERLDFLGERIDAIQNLETFLSEDSKSLDAEYAAIQNKLERLRRIQSKLLSMREPLDKRRAKNMEITRRNRPKREEYERERLRLLSEIAARERWLAQRDLLFESTANKPWAKGIEINGKIKKALAHQLEGAHRLVSAQRGILADKPGLGKTLQAIMTIDMLRAEGKGQKVLIFTPKSVVKDFERAFKRWTDPALVFELTQVSGKGVKTDVLATVEHINVPIVVITNYEVWRRDKSVLQKLIDCGFDTVILDEAHVLKDSKSKTSQDVRELIYAENKCPTCGHKNFSSKGFARFCAACEFEQKDDGDFCSVKNVYPMTGTPVLNKPGEIFFLLNLLDRKAYPSEKSFLQDYCQREYNYEKESYYYTFGTGGADKLLKRLDMRYTGRNRDSAGVEMPPQEVKHHYLELDPEKYPRQHAFVQELRDNARLVFTEDAQLTQPAILAWYMRMRQAASWPDAVKVRDCPHEPQCWVTDEETGTEKLRCPSPVVVFPPPGTPPINESVIMDASEEIVSESVEDGDRIVVFSMYRGPIAELERRCLEKGLKVGVIHGDVPDGKRQVLIDDFNINHTKVGQHKYDVLICQYGTAAVGLNFSGAHQALFIEREWNPGKEEQAMDRIRRLDSEHETIVHVLHCPGTATDLIDALQDEKKAIIEGFEAEVNLQEAMRKFLEG